MRRWILLIVAVAVVIVIVAGGLFSSAFPDGVNPAAIPDQVLCVFVEQYPDLQPYLPTSPWKGGLYGVDTYLYESSGWTVQVNLTKNSAYNVSVVYQVGNMSAIWEGTYLASVFMETNSATHYIPHENTPEDLILIDVFTFIRAQHPEPEPYAASVRFKGTEVPNPDGVVGTSTCMFTGKGWTVFFVSSIVPDPIVQVNATLVPTDRTDGQVLIYWEGTWQNRTVTETIFRYTEPPDVSASTKAG